MSVSHNQRGDTLVEVTLALAILSLVLAGAFTTANRAFNLGQNAKERSQLVSDAQQQAEALESFRDSHSWPEFLNGGPGYSGIRTRLGSPDCDLTIAAVQHCFHMEQQTVGGKTQWLPVVGLSTGSQTAGLSTLYITTSDVIVAPSYDFTIAYRVPPRGGGPDLANSLKLKLVDLDGLRP